MITIENRGQANALRHQENSMNEQLCKAGEHARALRAALLGAQAHADPMTALMLENLIADASYIESRLAAIDAALVAAGRDDE